MPTSNNSLRRSLRKVPTGVSGFDEITGGGLPEGRVTLVYGGPGSGKTLFGMHFLLHGALEREEPGVMLCFEESAGELAANAAVLSDSVLRLIGERKLFVDHVSLPREELIGPDGFDLDVLLARLDYAIGHVGARRVVIDALGAMLAAIEPRRLRAELVRLARHLKSRDVTAVLTAEPASAGDGAFKLTRHGAEQYVADCVIRLDHRVREQLSTRRLRVVKYRGTAHGTDEYPFLIGERGIRLFPTSLGAPPERSAAERSLFFGGAGVDALFGGDGLYRGSATMISGVPGSGKTLLCSQALATACARGERALMIGFEEPAFEIERNAALIGAPLAPHRESGALCIAVESATQLGLEAHLDRLYMLLEEHRPDLLVVDPLSALHRLGSALDCERLMLRLLHHVKSRGTTAIYTMMTREGEAGRAIEIVSAVDAWLELGFDDASRGGGRAITVLKARGIDHVAGRHPLRISGQGLSVERAPLAA